jgi:hypothetical protein
MLSAFIRGNLAKIEPWDLLNKVIAEEYGFDDF